MVSHPISLTLGIWAMLYNFCRQSLSFPTQKCCPQVLESFTFIWDFSISGSLDRLYGTNQLIVYLEMLSILAMSSKAMFNKVDYFKKQQINDSAHAKQTASLRTLCRPCGRNCQTKFGGSQKHPHGAGIYDALVMNDP